MGCCGSKAVRIKAEKKTGGDLNINSKYNETLTETTDFPTDIGDSVSSGELSDSEDSSELDGQDCEDLRSSGYRVIRCLGVGATAKVYEIDARGVRYAAKVFKKGVSVDTVECENMKKFHHPNILKTIGIITTNSGSCCVIMELLMGGPVTTTKDVRKTFKEILSAVEYLHRQGYAHRDIKSDNILLDSEGTAKLIDFGTCEKVSEDVTPSLKGTPFYWAPELQTDFCNLFAADIWALGVLLYFLIFGDYPFKGTSTPTLLKAIRSEQLVFPNNSDPQANALISKMLERSIDQRIYFPDIWAQPWLMAK